MSLAEKQQRIGAWCGLVAAVCFLVGTTVPALAFTGCREEAYSPLNHFVSELGDARFSELGVVFNVSLMVAGALLCVFIVGLWRYLATKSSRAVLGTGLFAAVATIFVGVFPEHNVIPHLIAAVGFFCGGLMTVGLFVLEIFLSRKGNAPKPAFLMAPAVLAFIFFVTLVLLPKKGLLEFLKNPVAFDRPDFWALPTCEWLVMVSVFIWICTCSIMMLRSSENVGENKHDL